MPYIIHVALLLSGCYLLYQFLLRSETFFGLNRWLLMICVCSSFILPTLEIPASWSLRQVNTGIARPTTSAPISALTTEQSTKKTIPFLLQESNQEAGSPANIQDQLQPIDEAVTVSTFKPINWQKGLQYVYFIGLAIFGINFLIQLSSLIWMIIKNQTIKDGKFRIIEMTQDKAPFSFLNNIFINPTKYDWETYNQILEHEKIHVEERHTLDILFAELTIIFQWFNPFAWRYRQAIEGNLEFLTDSRMLQKGTDRTTYQLNLLKISTPDYPLNITTNYNQSFLKKRIMMMEAKKSSMRSAWKYLLLLPLFGLSIISLNAVRPDFTTPYQQGITTQIDGENGDFEIPTNGDFQAKTNGNLVCVRFMHDEGEEGENITWSHKKCFEKTAFSDLSTAQTTFTITRATGELVFTGTFDGKTANGTYEFKPNNTFKKELTDFDQSEITASTLFLFFLNNTDAAYIAYVKSQNFEDFGLEDLEGLSLFGVSLEELKATNSGLKSLGYEAISLGDIQELNMHHVSTDYIKKMNTDMNRRLKIEEVVEAKIHNVDPAYIQKLEAAGLKNLDFDMITQFSIHNIEVGYIKSLQNAGLGDLDEEEIVSAAIHKVNPEMIKKYQAANLDNLDFEDIIGFAAHNVDIDYIKSLRAAGLTDLKADEVVSAAIHNVNPETIKKYQNAGLKGLDFEDIINFAAHNIKIDYIKSLQNADLGKLAADDLLAAAIHNVQPEAIKKYQALNLKGLSFEDIIGFAAHNVDISYIKSLQKAGLGDLESEDVIAAAIHNVDPTFIKKYQNAGLNDLDFEDIINFAIHNVELDFIESLRKAGLEALESDDIVNAAIHNVTPQTIQMFQSANIESIDFEDIINFSIHNIDLAFIQSFRNAGFTNLNSEDIMSAKIHGVDAAFAKSILNLGFKNPTLDDIIQLKLHHIDADYIKQKRAEGFDNNTLEDYVDLKIGQ